VIVDGTVSADSRFLATRLPHAARLGGATVLTAGNVNFEL